MIYYIHKEQGNNLEGGTTMYKVTKVNSRTEEMSDCGIYSMEDVKAICKGYKQDEFLTEMWTREGSKYFYIVEEVR